MTQFKTDKPLFKKAPEFTQVTGYINTNPIKLSDLKGKVSPNPLEGWSQAREFLITHEL